MPLTVKCYDCHEYVYDLKTHRKICPNSRYTKSKMKHEKINPFGRTRNLSHTTDYYALLDVSGSMYGSRLQNAKETLSKEVFPRMKDNDRISIVTFDTHAYFKLKPRPVGQIRRQNELPALLDRIFAGNFTAIWDAIHLTVSQIRDKNKRTVLVVLTDGEDNSSSHTYEQVRALVNEYNNISLDIIHISDKPCTQYQEICQDKGSYKLIGEVELSITFSKQFLERMENVM
uniref:VWFA domain-containing protein n=1 Tax=viral metagenome TaxID=1070528 RepID=A0A6C0EK32_9ZZZZ